MLNPALLTDIGVMEEGQPLPEPTVSMDMDTECLILTHEFPSGMKVHRVVSNEN